MAELLIQFEGVKSPLKLEAIGPGRLYSDEGYKYNRFIFTVPVSQQYRQNLGVLEILVGLGILDTTDREYMFVYGGAPSVREFNLELQLDRIKFIANNCKFISPINFTELTFGYYDFIDLDIAMGVVEMVYDNGQ